MVQRKTTTKNTVLKHQQQQQHPHNYTTTTIPTQSNHHHTTTGLKKHVLKGHLGRVTAVLHQWPQQRLISTSTDRNILYWHSQQATEPVDTPTNLTHAELLERQSGGVVGSACIDYFHYTAEEYYKDAAGEVVEASNKDSLSHLLQDNWSDDDE